MQIEIKITERRAELQGSCVLVCGNTGDTVKFIFDNEWGQYSNKTARFGFIKEGAWYYSDVLFDGSVCEIPMLSGIDFVEVGVYAGNLSTTTPARVPTKRSILCRNGLEHEPPPADVYNEILAAVSGKLSTTGGTVTGDYYKDGNVFIHEGNLDKIDPHVQELLDADRYIETATGNALTLDSSQAPLHGLKLYGKTTQDGTPTPDAPIESKSVGDSGSFEVGVYGKNLFNINGEVDLWGYNGAKAYTNSVSGNILTANSDILASHGVGQKIRVNKGTTITFSVKTVNFGTGNRGAISIYETDKGYNDAKKVQYCNALNTIYKLTYTAESEELIFAFSSCGGTGAQYTDIQVEIGAQATPYEPFKEQSITFTDTLRGVGDIADEKDFARGVKTERIKEVLAKDYTLYPANTTDNYFVAYIFETGLPSKENGISSHLPFIASYELGYKTGFFVGRYTSPIHISIPKTIASDITTLRQWLIDNNVKFYYPLSNPIETPISESELNAYRHLHTNKPNTTILSEADMEVDYYINKPNAQAIGNIHSQINKDYFKLQQAIITLGGSTL